MEDVELVVKERALAPVEPVSVVRGELLIDGRAPTRPVLLAFESSVYSHVPDWAPDALVWTDDNGRFEFRGPAEQSYCVVARERIELEDSSWIDFGGGFPRHGRQWPFTVTLPPSGEIQVLIRLPSESVWSEIAPPRER